MRERGGQGERKGERMSKGVRGIDKGKGEREGEKMSKGGRRVDERKEGGSTVT